MAAMLLAPAARAAGASWLLRYVGRSTNEAMWDPKFDGMLSAVLPDKLRETVRTNFGGPPGPVLGRGPHLVLTACREHDCDDKAFLWIDTQADAALGVAAACPGLPTGASPHRENDCRLTLGSRRYRADTVPEAARRAVMAWLRDQDMAVSSAAFIGPDSIERPQDAGAYAIAARARPASAPGG